MSELNAALALLAASLAAALLLRTAWNAGVGPLRAGLILAGWAVLAGGLWLAIAPYGPARGVFVALTLLSLGPLAVVIATIELS